MKKWGKTTFIWTNYSIYLLVSKYIESEKWKSWHLPSMVTHTRNWCFAFNPSKCTHTAVRLVRAAFTKHSVLLKLVNSRGHFSKLCSTVESKSHGFGNFKKLNKKLWKVLCMKSRGLSAVNNSSLTLCPVMCQWCVMQWAERVKVWSDQRSTLFKSTAVYAVEWRRLSQLYLPICPSSSSSLSFNIKYTDEKVG